ncbi:hypothetical protein [Occallatibacter savannae]|uniref:hypothetical protein n=1 Tax=Occallatibacter savannae TaxID=1002691 RepID=UPI0013A58AED|nr:hypothetical protein [Occallatibacter savannae]
MTERGIYISLIALNWRDGSISWSEARLAKKLGIDRRTIGKFLEKYRLLTEPLQEISSESPSLLHSGSTKVTFPKLQAFAEKLGKNVSGAKQSRGEQTEVEDRQIESSSSAAASSSNAATLSLSSRDQPGRNKPECPRNAEQAIQPVSPPIVNRPSVNLPDIRNWPESESRFGVPGSRLRNCLRYQLDHSSDDWYRTKAYPNMTRMNSETYVRKLDADTPPGWSPETVQIDKKAAKAKLQTDLGGYKTRGMED